MYVYMEIYIYITTLLTLSNYYRLGAVPPTYRPYPFLAGSYLSSYIEGAGPIVALKWGGASGSGRV